MKARRFSLLKTRFSLPGARRRRSSSTKFLRATRYRELKEITIKYAKHDPLISLPEENFIRIFVAISNKILLHFCYK